MTAVLLVPAVLVLLTGLLLWTAWLEDSVVSPRAVMRSVMRVRVTPDRVEQVVAAECERVLGRRRSG